MRLSQGFTPTLRDVPAEAEISSHQLSLRAGLIRRSAAGMYTYLPLGYRVIKKIMNIIREELDRIGGQELMMPIVQQAELWQQSGRWDAYGDEMFRLTDRHGREYCLAPTHEELVTSVVRANVDSYRDLPLSVYQIQNKYRDEIRPRFGVIRSREFIMKDAYSFDIDEDGLHTAYMAYYSAYERIFNRCGVRTYAVEADSGAIGGSHTHEFMVLADVGEDVIVTCPECGYAANVEHSPALPTRWGRHATTEQMAEVATPGAMSIQEVSDTLNVTPSQIVKTLIYLADERPVAVLLRGDRELNEIKLARALGATNIEMAPPSIIEEVTGAPVGFSGPVGLDGIHIVADEEIASAVDAVVGANKEDMHIVHAVWGRDFKADQVADLRLVQHGETCPECKKGALHSASGIEVGHVFKLGDTYSRAMNACYKDDRGQEKPFLMGCYGIGVTRTMAAIIEQHHDEKGIVWPVSVAPYIVVIVPINAQDEMQNEAANRLYDELWAAGIDTVLDDRNERPGVKFTDAELIGYPVRVTVGPRSLKEGRLEVTWRDTGETETPLLTDVVQMITAGINVRKPKGLSNNN